MSRVGGGSTWRVARESHRIGDRSTGGMDIPRERSSRSLPHARRPSGAVRRNLARASVLPPGSRVHRERFPVSPDRRFARPCNLAVAYGPGLPMAPPQTRIPPPSLAVTGAPFSDSLTHFVRACATRINPVTGHNPAGTDVGIRCGPSIGPAAYPRSHSWLNLGGAGFRTSLTARHAAERRPVESGRLRRLSPRHPSYAYRLEKVIPHVPEGSHSAPPRCP